MTLTEALQHIEGLTAENKSLKEDLELTEVALHREVEEHAKASASMKKFFRKNVVLNARVRELNARVRELEARVRELTAENKSLKEDNVELTGRLKSIEEHLLYMYRHNTLEADAELKKPEDYFSFHFYTIKATESLVAQATLLNFFDYDYLQLRKMV